MAQHLTEETIKYVAALAKLRIEGSEAEAALRDMQRMLDYVDMLGDVDTEGVEPMSHIFPLRNVFREDTVTNGDMRDEVLANAPEEEDDQYVVPITIE